MRNCWAVVWAGVVSLVLALVCEAAGPVVKIVDSGGQAGRLGVPVSAAVDLAGVLGAAAGGKQIVLTENGRAEAIAAQFEASGAGSSKGRLWWVMPPGGEGERAFTVELRDAAADVMRVQRNPAGGQFELRDRGKSVLVYNYGTVEPGAILAKVSADNLKYARPRSDYIHPLYGLDGEELTKDWSVDHPHHRGIYWAWPEVDYQGERGDLHALQRVFARPTGRCEGSGGPLYAQIVAENEWKWDDKQPIVREQAIIRAWRAGAEGRFVDLEFRFRAIDKDVPIARRGMAHYGGLNIRLSAVTDQEIVFHTDPPEQKPRKAWSELAGVFPQGKQWTGVAVFQDPANPDYPADGIKYPELNWFQPTFPAAGTRYVLKSDRTLVLRYRFWIHRGKSDERQMAEIWRASFEPAEVITGK